MRWVGRLPGDLLSTIPVEYEAWWLGQGKAFNSHPLRWADAHAAAVQCLSHQHVHLIRPLSVGLAYYATASR